MKLSLNRNKGEIKNRTTMLAIFCSVSGARSPRSLRSQITLKSLASGATYVAIIGVRVSGLVSQAESHPLPRTTWPCSSNLGRRTLLPNAGFYFDLLRFLRFFFFLNLVYSRIWVCLGCLCTSRRRVDAKLADLIKKGSYAGREGGGGCCPAQGRAFAP